MNTSCTGSLDILFLNNDWLCVSMKPHNSLNTIFLYTPWIFPILNFVSNSGLYFYIQFYSIWLCFKTTWYFSTWQWWKHAGCSLPCCAFVLGVWDIAMLISMPTFSNLMSPDMTYSNDSLWNTWLICLSVDENLLQSYTETCEYSRACLQV